jgi:hypothetical protein
MNTLSRKLLFIVLLLVANAVSAVTRHDEILVQSEWPEHVNGTNIATLPQVRQILRRFEEDNKIAIEIYHPSGESGRLWAETLGRWFVTFGVPAQYLELLPGSGGADRLVISLIDRR